MKDLLDLINLSISDPIVQKFIDNYQLKTNSIKNHLGETIVLENNLSSKNNVIGLNLDTDKQISSVYIEDSIENKGIELPQGTYLSDTMDVVSDKLGTQPFLMHKNASDNIPKKYIYTYLYKDKCLVVGFDKHRRMLSFSCAELYDYLKPHLSWRESLPKKQLNSSIDIPHIKQQSPLKIWQERLDENEEYRRTKNPEFIEDYWYTQERLNEFETIIDDYLLALNIKCTENDALGVEQELKICLNRIDDFNGKINMIETDEREELAPYFDKTIIATGLTLPENFDPTLAYRNW